MHREFPTAFQDNMRCLLRDEFDAFMDASKQPAYRAFRLQRFTDAHEGIVEDIHAPLSVAHRIPVPEALRASLKDPVAWYPDAFYLAPDSLLGKTIYHELGAVYIQEPSAMAAIAALDPQPGEQILDLCAAPGSKTTAIGRALGGTGTLVCNEIHPARVQILAQNLERTGIPALVVNAPPDRLTQAWPNQFDAVLVDAPCSGEGMFRKDPDAIAQWRPEQVEVCAARQREILTHAVRLVRAGGRLVYSTCTLNTQENEEILAWALAHLPVEIEQLPLWPGWRAALPEAIDAPPAIAGARRLWPHTGRGEGHFVARLRVLSAHASQRKSECTSGRLGKHKQTRPPQPSAGRDVSAALANWLQEDEIPSNWLQPLVHGDGAFVETVSHLETHGIRVIRNGICVATREHQDWKPHHQLAMALRPGVAMHEQCLGAKDAVRYVAGEALAQNRDKGFFWMHLEGLPLGWGKAVPGRINNNYPKGLRKRVREDFSS